MLGKNVRAVVIAFDHCYVGIDGREGFRLIPKKGSDFVFRMSGDDGVKNRAANVSCASGSRIE